MKRLREAKRYAKTLLDTVGIENAPQAINELNTVNELMMKSKALKSLLVNPQFTLEEREKIIKQIAGALKLSDNIVKFIMHLSELKLIIHLSDIISIAISFYLEKKKRAKAVVMTPIEIGKDYENRLISSLKKLTERDIDIEYVIDPSLLGGILVRVYSSLYDTSLKGQLKLLRNELIGR
ncbi:MAG: ATP synthase F1 subunit delta [Nitrospirota bacterium]